VTHEATAAGRAATGAYSTWAVVVVGVLAGFLAGLFGVGGGILIVPGLVLAVGMPQRLAHGTSLAAVLPISVASVLTYLLHDNVDWPVALWLSIGAVAGAVIGTRLLVILPVRMITVLFVVLSVASAVRLFVDVDADGRAPLTVLGSVELVAVGLAAGILAGLLGVGGGIIVVPAMILLLGMDPTIAKGTSAAMIIPTALIGTWRNRRTANADLGVAAVVGVAGIVTAAAGAVLSDRLDDDLSNVLFAMLLLAVAVRLAWRLARQREAVDGDL
jgi:uncharacterized membrane protein YfcA